MLGRRTDGGPPPTNRGVPQKDPWGQVPNRPGAVAGPGKSGETMSPRKIPVSAARFRAVHSDAAPYLRGWWHGILCLWQSLPTGELGSGSCPRNCGLVGRGGPFGVLPIPDGPTQRPGSSPTGEVPLEVSPAVNETIAKELGFGFDLGSKSAEMKP